MKHTNQLTGEKSPYLLQHAHNPVEWLPWGEAAFDRARHEDKPIFLSVGYSTCHWCHVMERESFENEAVAQVMNEHFVNIKVDREERPDIDRIYMTFVQHASGGQGGWPMSVFLTPDLKPFYGGTYFPPMDAYGRPGFVTLLRHIAHAWTSDRANVLQSGESVASALREMAEAKGETEFVKLPWDEIAARCYQQIAGTYDAHLGGFGDAPKFPRPVTHDFLHRHFTAGGPEEAVEMSRQTLRAMALGGMNDQLGGGFHRYSVDSAWIVSHFEKMLYDQAQLVNAHLEMFQLTGDEFHAQIARDTLDYVLRDMTHENGGFFAAEDADSAERDEGGGMRDENSALIPHPSSLKKEGAFYVWTWQELEDVLGEDAPLFCAYYGVKPEGNAPSQGDPHGEFKGKNILYRAGSLETIAAHFERSAGEVEEVLARSREKLMQVRATRPRPHRDEKIIVAWNGLMISAFARAAQVLDDEKYLNAARRAAAFIRAELWDESAATLRRHWMNGPANVPGFAADYAFLSLGLLDLFEAGFDNETLWWAEAVLRTLNEQFFDTNGGAYFDGAPSSDILVRLKEDYDGAEPSASSLAALANLRLAQLFDDDDFRAPGVATLHAFSSRLMQVPSALPAMVSAAIFAASPPLHIVIAGEPNADDTRALLRVLHSAFIPYKTVVLADGGAAHAELSRRAGWIAEMKPINGKAAAYVCRNFACRQPVTSAEELEKALLEGGSD